MICNNFNVQMAHQIKIYHGEMQIQDCNDTEIFAAVTKYASYD